MRLLPICCFLLLIWATACSPGRADDAAYKKEIHLAKTVPLVYRSAEDPGFTVHADTVFYAGATFSGYRFMLFPGDDTAVLQSYFNGVEEGFQRKWYPGSQPAEERFYINGKKEGVHRSWWPDGKPKMYFEAYNDEYDGIFREWYSSGVLAKEFHYVNGREEGSEKLWWDNGTVRANYVIRNGKKYGLLGLKTCINPYDTVIKK